MKKKEFRSIGKHLVLGGYVLLVVVMLIGLFALYRNLVRFSESKINTEDRQELLVVSNVINQLYEVEAANNLLTYESAIDYIEAFDSIRPIVSLRIDTLKQLTTDTMRVFQLDSLNTLLDSKLENLEAVLVLMDSLRQGPSLMRESTNRYLPKKSKIPESAVDSKGANNKAVNVDTTVVKREKRGFFRRLGDAITGKEDSTLIVETRQSTVVQKDYDVVVDTIVNIVRETERLNFENQRRFQTALANRQSVMNANNQTLTARVDGLLKLIEKEEREKLLALVETREEVLSNSYSTVFWVSIIAVLIAVVFGLMFLVDINRSQRYKQKLEESNIRINKLLKSREKMMLSISHDIKAPMSSVLGYIELIESGVNKESHDAYISNMKQSSEHILQLVSNFLDFQRIESHTWRNNEMSILLSELVDNTAESFEPLAHKKNLSFVVENNIPKDLTVFSDPFIIREIYSNVISNAIKYTIDGEVAVSINFDESDNMLHLSVKDTGVGISEEDRHLVFEEFERINAESIDHYAEGTGLGMAITKGLVDQLKGMISFVSEKGVGTEFFVDIPLSLSKETLLKNEEIVIECIKKRFDDVSVLLVDDDTIQQLMVSEMLKTQGVNVTSVTNPTKVIDILKKKSFDLIFLDIQMPEINGFALIKKIQESGVISKINTPIVALTATSEVKLQEYIDSGFSNYLNKPFTSSDLFDIVSEALQVKGDKTKSVAEYDSKGVEALISYVKDDKASSIAILQAFCNESNLLKEHLSGSGKVDDINATSKIAHKMLPLFKMIEDDEVVSVLLSLELKKPTLEYNIKNIIERVEYYVNQANNTISEMSKS